MGILRFLLAIAVLLDHLPAARDIALKPRFGPGATLAVEIFFMISGFYMALILGEKYVGKNGVRAFYRNRFLRIYPVYIFVVCMSFLIAVYYRIQHGHWIFLSLAVPMFLHANWLTRIHVIVSNLFLVGQNTFFFLDNCPDGSLGLHCGGANALPPWVMFLIPQAWSIEIEVFFYLICPFIIHLKTKTLSIIACVLITLKIYTVFFIYHLQSGYFNLRFPGFEFALFLLGILAYRIYKNYLKEKKIPSFGYGIILVFVLAASLCHFLFKDMGSFISIYITAFLALPILFRLSKNSKIDRFIGELSYPIYLIHAVVMVLVFYWVGKEDAPLAIAAVIVAALLLNYFILRPIDAFRAIKSAANKPAPVPVTTRYP